MRVQSEIKMTDVKPETLKPDITDEIYVKFQRTPHFFCIRTTYIVEGMLVRDDVRVGEQVKMAAWNRK